MLSYKQATCTHSRSHSLAASPSLSCAYMAFCTLVHIHGFCSNTYFATWGLRSHTSMARAHTLALTLLQHHSCCLAHMWPFAHTRYILGFAKYVFCSEKPLGVCSEKQSDSRTRCVRERVPFARNITLSRSQRECE